MTSEKDYRTMAEEYLRMASDATDSVAATLLRMLADDYFNLAKTSQAVVTQQQQIQPKEPEPDEK